MTIYKYYSIIEWIPEENIFAVTFPDLENCFTDGENLAEAIFMAEDALGLLLLVEEEHGNHIPKASSANEIQIPDGASLVQIVVDTDNFEEIDGELIRFADSGFLTNGEDINEALTYSEGASLHLEDMNEDTDFKEEQVRELYNEFLSEKEMNFVMGMETDNLLIENHKAVIDGFLKYAKSKGQCTYSQNGNLFVIDGERYIIKILVIHNGDACCYTINKRSDYIGNRRRMMFTEATENYLETFL